MIEVVDKRWAARGRQIDVGGKRWANRDGRWIEVGEER